MQPRSPLVSFTLSSEGLFRFQAVSRVLAWISRGHSRTRAVQDVAAEQHFTLAGHPRLVSARTLLRWLAAFEKNGAQGLDPVSRPAYKSCSVLSADFLKFLAEEKKADVQASLPELIRRAREKGILKPTDLVDRSTVYRVCRRLGIDVARRKQPHGGDSRRFAYPHRMQMVLCDGKHYRAGVSRAKRVALFYLDDATRYGLHVVVGTSETQVLFLRGLYELITYHGFMDGLYLDHGPGFIGLDTLLVVAYFNILLIHGTASYPEGHGKIEAFNRSAKQKQLRLWDGRPDIDPYCGAQELRLQHYLREVYNKTPHSALGFKTPEECFLEDPRPLRLPPDMDKFRAGFVAHPRRRVSKDHIVTFGPDRYELPTGCGYGGTRVTLHRNVLDGRIHFLHQGRMILLHPVDLAKNARSRRGKGPKKKQQDIQPLTKGAADLAYEQDFSPLVDPDGGFSDLT